MSAVAPADWDAFVESSPNGAYPQLRAWADVKRANGWEPRLLLPERSAIGAQLLVRRLGPSPWAVGYAPRGPVAERFDTTAVASLTERIRGISRQERLSHVTVDPEIEAPHPLTDSLRSEGWRQAAPIQPDRTRLVDLTGPEEALWSDLRSKWRQYVQKARRAGVTIEEAGADALGESYAIYAETARRAGFVHRAESAYRRTYEAFTTGGRARLLFAVLDGQRVATLILFQCGRKVTEPYGGMTAAGADSRANYLLKWEALRSSKERGFGAYDMWGLSHAGIEHFKQGFGGREVHYIGAWELVSRPAIRAGVELAQRVRVAVARRRHGVGGSGAVAGAGEA
jgi:lipid II:glycine glycyltransferase (peptidoglycan interpeptide bridge formation enzyme)